MHSMMEGEGGSEPQDVFVELGTLIVEGRVPGGGNARGYSEGPHCTAQGPSNATTRHLCNPQQNLLCKRAENFRKQMLLMFQNNIPMCIEVLLCSDCPCGALKAQSADVGVVPSASDLLLEQWTVTFVSSLWLSLEGSTCLVQPILDHHGGLVELGIRINFHYIRKWRESLLQLLAFFFLRINEPAPMLARGLVQAVRSQLHFSQLSAWWSSTKGSRPSHVSYRITVPGQAFSSQFSRQPNEHTFPLASVGKHGAIKVCARSLPRMELVPSIHCPLHSACLLSATENGEKLCLPKPFLPGPASNSETSVCGTSVEDGAKGSSLGESLLDPPQRFRSPPRASEAPDRFLLRRLLTEVVGARWQGDTPPSPPLGLPGSWWKPEVTHCLSSKRDGQVCPRAAAAAATAAGASMSRNHPNDQGKGKPCETAGLLDDRMQMECNMPGKHHCSCEVEEEIEEVKAPAQVRQRRRSQASMPSHPIQPLPSTSAASDATYTCSGSNLSEGVANESTKRSSGLAVMADEYFFTNEGVNGSNTGSLKRRRPVMDVVDASALQGKSWMDADGNLDLTPGVTNANSSGLAGGDCGASPFALSPAKGATAPIQLQPPLSERELQEVLSVLRDRNKPNVRPSFQTQQVFFSLESTTKLKDVTDSNNEISGAPCPLLRQCLSGEKDKINCDKIWSDTKHTSCVKRNVLCNDHSSGGVNVEKPSYDLSEDHNNQVICDKHTSLQKCDIGDSYLCLSCVSQTQASQAKEGTQPITSHSSQISSSKIAPVSPRPVRARSRMGDCSSSALAVQCVSQEMHKDIQNGCNIRQDVPSASERARFRRSFDSAASMVFHTRTGLPLTSSPAPVRRGTSHFDYDSSLNSVSAIRSALFETPAIASQMEDTLSLSSDDTESESGARSPCSPDAGIAFPSPGPCHALSPCSSLLGSFEESVLNGRLEPVSTVQGFTAEIGASGSFCPRHLKLPVTVFFYTLGDYDKVSTPYLGHINLGKKGYNVPKSGTIQVTLFNPMETVIKMFVVMYDLTDMPPNSHTFLRQRTLYMPTGTEVSDDLPDSEMTQKWLRYLIHLRFSSSKSGRIYLHTDVRMIIFRKSDMDTATVHNNNNIDSGYELRSFTHGPGNPKFSPR